MKRNRFLFIAECGIILVLLLLIAILADKGDQGIQQQVHVVTVEEKPEIEETVEQESIQDIVKEVEAEVIETSSLQTVSENSAVSDNSMNESEEDMIEVVVFGDSIWYTHDEEIGIPALIEEKLNVKIYNCAIGGTTAAVTGDSTELEDWSSNSFNGMVYIARGKLDGEDIIGQEKAYEILKEVNFDEIDYVIVSYGLNDYFCDVPIHPQTYYDMTSYVGALRHGVHKLKKSYPHLEIILTSPTYCEWFKGERQFDVGGYVEAARGVADEMELHFLDMYHALGKSPEEKMQYLSDGVHLNPEGERLYAHGVTEYLKELGAKEKE